MGKRVTYRGLKSTEPFWRTAWLLVSNTCATTMLSRQSLRSCSNYSSNTGLFTSNNSKSTELTPSSSFLIFTHSHVVPKLFLFRNCKDRLCSCTTCLSCFFQSRTFKLARTNDSDESHCQENNGSLRRTGRGGGGEGVPASPVPLLRARRGRDPGVRRPLCLLCHAPPLA